MPTPRPIRVASVGEKVAMSIAWASRPVAARPQPSARTAQISGSSVAHREPKAIASTIAAATNPISFARAALLLRGLLDPVAAQLHLESVAARVLGGGDQLVVGGLGDVGDRLLAVHVHGRERDPAVLGDLALCGPLGERAVDPFDVRELGDPVQRAFDPRMDGRVGDVLGGEHHLVGVRGLGVEVLVEQIQGGGGLRSRQRERVRVARPGFDAQAAQHHEGQHPGRQDPEAMGEAPAR